MHASAPPSIRILSASVELYPWFHLWQPIILIAGGNQCRLNTPPPHHHPLNFPCPPSLVQWHQVFCDYTRFCRTEMSPCRENNTVTVKSSNWKSCIIVLKCSVKNPTCCELKLAGWRVNCSAVITFHLLSTQLSLMCTIWQFLSHFVLLHLRLSSMLCC